MRETFKKKTLKTAEKLIRTSAVKAGGIPTWLGFHEPKMPEKLKELIKTEK